MNILIRLWNKNRKRIIMGVIVIAFVIFVLQILNNIAKDNKLKRLENANKYVSEEKLPTQSIITGQEISEEKTRDNISVIDKFINKCNTSDIDGAYELLTDDCKRLLFPTKEDFVNKYYKIVFAEKKSYGIEFYKKDNEGYVYEVKYYNNALTTGKVSNDNLKDYITVKMNLEKININNYIKTKQVNIEVENKGLLFKFSSIDIYQEYIRYNIEIENKTDKTILLKSKENLNGIYMVDDRNSKYVANTSEMPSDYLILSSQSSKKYKMRFNMPYNPDLTINSIHFTDIVSDYDKYIVTPEEAKDRTKINIQM